MLKRPCSMGTPTLTWPRLATEYNADLIMIGAIGSNVVERMLMAPPQCRRDERRYRRLIVRMICRTILPSSNVSRVYG